MPNWNTSSIKISINENADLTQAQRQVRWEVWRDLRNVLEEWVNNGRDTDRGSPDVFKIIHPRPEEEDDNWYEWNNENWGTKWDMRVFNSEFKDGELRFYGETAWNAPIGILNKLVSLGFNLKHLFASMENEDWGYHIHRNLGITHFETSGMGHTYHITDSSLEDFTDTQWNPEDLTDDELQQLALRFTLTGDFVFEEFRGLDDDDLRFFQSELYHIVNENFESLENHIDRASDDEFKELRSVIMESLDDLKDKGYVNDGFYLQWCNQLKGVQQGDFNGLQGISEYIYLVKAQRHDMIQYYNREEEPNLIKMYEVF